MATKVIVPRLEEFGALLLQLSSIPRAQRIDAGDWFDTVAAVKARMAELHKLAAALDGELLIAKKRLVEAFPDAPRSLLKIWAPTPSYTWSDNLQNLNRRVYTVTWPINEVELKEASNDLSAEILRATVISIPKDTPQCATVEQHLDGPDLEAPIWWRGGQPKPLSRRNWQLAIALWGKGAVEFSLLGSEIWNDETTPANTIKSQISRLGDALLEIDPSLSTRLQGESAMLTVAN